MYYAQKEHKARGPRDMEVVRMVDLQRGHIIDL